MLVVDGAQQRHPHAHASSRSARGFGEVDQGLVRGALGARHPGAVAGRPGAARNSRDNVLARRRAAEVARSPTKNAGDGAIRGTFLT